MLFCGTLFTKMVKEIGPVEVVREQVSAEVPTPGRRVVRVVRRVGRLEARQLPIE